MSTTKATPGKRSSKTAKDSSTVKARRARRNAHMDPMKALWTTSLSNEQIHGILDDIAPKVLGLWGLATEHHKRIERLEELELKFKLLELSGEVTKTSVQTLDIKTRMLVREHELMAHDTLIATKPAPTQPRPQLTVLIGGRDIDAVTSNDRRPQLRVFEGGTNHD